MIREMYKVYSPMKRYIIALLLLLLCDDNALADSQAVQATNVLVGFASWDTSASVGTANNSYNINGDVTFPLTTYLGASLSGAFGHTRIPTNPYPSSIPTTTGSACSLNNDNLNAQLFVRDQAVGKVGVSYGVGRQESHCSSTFLTTGSDTQDTRSLSASAEYYFSKATLAVAATKTHLGQDSDLVSDSLTVNWYPISDMRVALSAFGLDLKDTYKVGLEYRPAFLDESLSLLVAYSSQHLTTESHSIIVGINYIFGQHVTLITRDRYYQ
jgi:hypothetical protein